MMRANSKLAQRAFEFTEPGTELLRSADALGVNGRSHLDQACRGHTPAGLVEMHATRVPGLVAREKSRAERDAGPVHSPSAGFSSTA
jgi:hypothetical protein